MTTNMLMIMKIITKIMKKTITLMTMKRMKPIIAMTTLLNQEMNMKTILIIIV
jgi:hypothetical protein